MAESDPLQALAERIRGSGILGRSDLMRRLFDFLIECSATGRAPKEWEVAVEVFGKDAGFDVAQDAMVRVYVHKLRRKLEEYYSKGGRGEPLRLVLPKGAYRLAVEHRDAHSSAGAPPGPAGALPSAGTAATPLDLPAAAAAAIPEAAARRPRVSWLAALLAVSVALNAALALHGLRSPAPAPAPAGALWSRMLADDRPILLVAGDYYIFGETDANMEVKRLVREFAINSAADLDHYVRLHPQDGERYLDMQLNYLPTSVAWALRDLLPQLAPAHSRLRVVLASELTPAMLKSADVIYLGYLSGMGMLGDLVFAGSRFAVGDSFDELVDRASGRRYISQAAVPVPGEDRYHDYGYFAAFDGPAGNQIMVIAGTRDVAVMNTAETVTRRATLSQLETASAGARSFEALYDVFAMDGTNLSGELLLASRLDTTKIWTEDAAPHSAAVPAAGLAPAQGAPPASAQGMLPVAQGEASGGRVIRPSGWASMGPGKPAR